jgi:hypothetical protein
VLRPSQRADWARPPSSFGNGCARPKSRRGGEGGRESSWAFSSRHAYVLPRCVAFSDRQYQAQPGTGESRCVFHWAGSALLAGWRISGARSRRACDGSARYVRGARVCGRGGSYCARVHFISAAGVKPRLRGGMSRRVRDGRPYASTLFFLDVQAGEIIV